MSAKEKYYVSKIREILSEKQKRNPRYSLRAFALDTGVPVSTLSLVLQGKRSLPPKGIDSIVSKLNLSRKEETIFRESAERKKNLLLDKTQISEDYLDRYVIDESYYKIISEWEHYALLSLIEIQGFQSSHDYVSQRLGITKQRSEEVVSNLLEAGLMSINVESEYVLSQNPLRTSEDISSNALKEGHKEYLEMSIEPLNELSIELRDFSSMTIAGNLNKVKEAKVIIREFRLKLASLLREGEKNCVFQFGLQLYPITDVKKGDMS